VSARTPDPDGTAPETEAGARGGAEGGRRAWLAGAALVAAVAAAIALAAARGGSDAAALPAPAPAGEAPAVPAPGAAGLSSPGVDAPASNALAATRGLAPADTAFAALIRRLSGEGAYFDTDNLISNETSYLHVAARLRALRGPRLAYVGVGPDQNFSYVAALRPEAAFILDIRRDNLLHHLLLKALMEASPTRADYLAALFGRPRPPARLRGESEPLAALLDWVEATPSEPVSGGTAGTRDGGLPADLRARIEGFGIDLSEEDLATIGRFHGEFVANGPGLRFRSHGRAPRWYYPTYRELLLERDEEGRQASYLAREEDYRFVRALQEADGIVPVVGDFAGPHALRAIGEEVGRRGLRVGAFYTSNVEFYLDRQQGFERYAASVATLPAAPGGVIVRSYFHRGRRHAETRPGYASTQLLQPIAAFVRAWRSGGIPSYRALVHGSSGDGP